MLIIFALVVFVYFGGKYVPTELKRYKEVILGIAIGCLICCTVGMNMEGLDDMDKDKDMGKGKEGKGMGMDGMGKGKGKGMGMKSTYKELVPSKARSITMAATE